jgi:2-succinyl-6-hydroxy-2,4-cyclohexadiene-1-carboxylate synthase
MAFRRDHRDHRVSVAGGAYRVHEWSPASRSGKGQRPIVLMLLHGFSGGGLVWERAVADLTTDALIVAPDLPGHGETRLEGDTAFSFEGAATALECVLESLGATSCLLHGYSMGGRLALYFAITRPTRVRALSLESASAGLALDENRSERATADGRLADFASENGIEAFVDRWETTPVLQSLRNLTKSDWERLRAVRLSNNGDGLAASLRGMGVGTQPYLGDRLSELSMPVLVITGSQDAKFTAIATDMAARLSRVSQASVADAGHTPHLEQPGAWSGILDAWIAGLQR